MARFDAGSTGSGDPVDAADATGTTVLADPTALLAGSNLGWTDNGDGTVTLDASATDTRVELQQGDGTTVLADPTALLAGSNLGLTDNGDGTATLDASGQMPDIVASGTVTLSGGSATVDTGVSSGHLEIALDPSGGGANSADVRASARVFWDNSDSDGTYHVEILEDGTSVGNPDIGYKVVRY